MIKELNEAYLQIFKDYLKNTPTQFDPYFLSEEMIDNFILDENFTYIYLEENKIQGTISIMKKYGTRLRILSGTTEVCQLLHDTVMIVLDLKSYKAFIDMDDTQMISFYDSSNMTYERTIYALERPVRPIEIEIQSKLKIRELKFPEDAEIYAHIRNEAFKKLKGFEYRTKDYFENMHLEEEYFEEATLLLSIDQPIGIIKAAKEIENDQVQAYIGPVAILPEYQGKGYGKYLLKYLINEVHTYGPYVCSLSVNADNEHALKLYYDLGFENVKIVKAYI